MAINFDAECIEALVKVHFAWVAKTKWRLFFFTSITVPSSGQNTISEIASF